MITLTIQAFFETLYMVFVASFFTLVLGLPIGAVLFFTEKNGLTPNSWVYKFLGGFVNAVRSIPFIILLVAITPFTRLIVGTSIGVNAAIVPLAVSAIPFYARIVESSLYKVPPGLIEAAQSMGATPYQILTKVLLSESLPSLIQGMTLTIVTLIGYSAMAGAIGGGGLGDLAIRYGYQRFDAAVMAYTVIILIILVQVIQYLGDFLARKTNKLMIT